MPTAHVYTRDGVDYINRPLVEVDRGQTVYVDQIDDWSQVVAITYHGRTGELETASGQTVTGWFTQHVRVAV